MTASELPMDAKEFHQRILEWETLGLDEIARRAKTNRTTAKRWLQGISCPHPIARESVFTALT